MAIITVKNRAINLDAAEIPNLDASKITTGTIDTNRISGLPASVISSGTFADARIAASNVSQHATSFDDNKIVNDISTLGLRVHTQENLNASNTSSASFDVFQDSSGISNLTTSARSTTGEYVSSATLSAGSASYETGNRQSIYTITKDSTTVDVTKWIDGGFTADASNSWYMSGGDTVDSNRFIRFDLGAGNSKIYQGVKEHTNNPAGNQGNWEIKASNDGSTWTTLKSSFTWYNGFGSTSGTLSWTNTTAYRYIEFRGVSGTDDSTGWHKELEWYVAPETSTLNASGSFEGTTITASSTSSMGAVLTYQDFSGTNSLNTDIILKLSADNGSNYSTATLTALPDFSTGIKMAKVNDLSVTAGTQLKYKIEFANQASGSKEARIRGVSLQY